MAKKKHISLPQAMRIIQGGGVIPPDAEPELRARLRRARRRLGGIFRQMRFDANAVHRISTEIADLEMILALNKQRKEQREKKIT